MKKKFTLSKVVIFMLAMALIMVLYCFLYMIPTRHELTAMQAEVVVANAEASVYRQYLSDLSPLQAEIDNIQKEIDELNATGYINNSNVSFELSDAVQRYHISLNSVSLGNSTTVQGHRALPINITMSGEYEDVLRFISHFENDQKGSYLVRGTSIALSANRASVSLVIYLCTPNV